MTSNYYQMFGPRDDLSLDRRCMWWPAKGRCTRGLENGDLTYCAKHRFADEFASVAFGLINLTVLALGRAFRRPNAALEAEDRRARVELERRCHNHN